MNRLLMSIAIAMIALLGSIPTGAQEVWTGPAHSGSWYSPERSGEGFTMQILDNGSVLALWFTYPPAGVPGEQAWIIAAGGRIEGDRIRFAQALTTRGPRFGLAFDPTQVQTIPWGTLEFRFTACNEAELDYAGPPTWGSGSRRLARLTALSELECTGKRHVTARGARAIEGLGSRSGMWYDPTHDGEGWTIEELPDGRAVVYWFTYDDQGEQAWTIGTASAAGGRITVAENLLPVGTHFGSAFNPVHVDPRAWGQLEFEFTSCGDAILRYESSLPAFGSGTLRPIRLTRPAGTICLEQKPSVPASGTWGAGAPMASPQSEIATASVESRSCLAGGYPMQRDFQCYDTLTNTWTVLAPLPSGRDHGEAIAFEGDIYFAGGNPENSAAPNGWRYRFAEARWEAIAELPFVVASGAAVLDGFAYFADESGSLVQFDPRTRESRLVPGDNRAARDHSQLVAFQGELWLIGGRGIVGTHGTVSIFDPASETWRAGPGLPIGTSGFAAAASPSVLFVAGGEQLGTSAVVLDSAHAIAAGDNQWTALPRLPIGVHGVGAAVHGNAFYMLGGSRIAAAAFNFGDVQIYRFGP